MSDYHIKSLEEYFQVYRKSVRNPELFWQEIAEEHFVLSTGKGYAHRPYLGKGVYADLTLIYKDKRFNELEWTYPDYKTETIQDILKKIRKIYLDNLKEENIYD